MARSQLDSVRSMYDERSEQYDENEVHVKQAKDYCSWADLKKGDSVLDLACGAGLVALGAKLQVGTSGHVVGVDISEGMLNVARRKAEAAGLEVPFFNHDISDLSDLRSKILPEESGGFDVITCAAALILLPDPLRAVENWMSLLRPGGRIVTDVQTRDANTVMNIFSQIAPALGKSVPWHSNLWQSQQALEKLMIDAGLEVQKIFETEAYAVTQQDLSEAENLFEQAMKSSMYKRFGEQEVRESAKKLFVQQFAEVAGPSGTINQETKYWMVVARKT